MYEGVRNRDCRTCLKYVDEPHTEWCPEGTWPLTMVHRAMEGSETAVQPRSAQSAAPVWAAALVSAGVTLVVASAWGIAEIQTIYRFITG